MPKVLTLKKTCLASPSQWEGTLEDDRAVYARFRHGHLGVGVGVNAKEAVSNAMSGRPPYEAEVGDRFDGFMDFNELKVHLAGLLEFPAGLVVENEDQPPPDPEALERLLRLRDAD